MQNMQNHLDAGKTVRKKIGQNNFDFFIYFIVISKVTGVNHKD